jgi:glycerate kinase
MRVVIAPDSFKGTLRALDVAQAIADGWRSVRPGDTLTLLPQADGGEGTLEVVAAAVPKAQLHCCGPVTGPDGRTVQGVWLELVPGTALVELAQSSGLPLMHQLDPLGATSRGLGEVIATALNSGAMRILIALGGSASTDGGAGALRALGMRLGDVHDHETSDGGAALSDIATVDLSGLRPIPAGVTLLTDVDAPLLGKRGAAPVFAPQKGASAQDVQLLERALTHYARVLGTDPATPGAGAAGGVAYGFLAAYSATISSGARWVAAVTGLPEALADANLVITGEGRYDSQSRTGKVTGNVIEMAQSVGCPAAVIAGDLSTDPGVAAWSLTALAGSARAAIGDPERWCYVAGSAVAAGQRWHHPSTPGRTGL